MMRWGRKTRSEDDRREILNVFRLVIAEQIAAEVLRNLQDPLDPLFVLLAAAKRSGQSRNKRSLEEHTALLAAAFAASNCDRSSA